ncbi:hypothetical protein TrRE_jg10752 [Triparma retinervis]|uniref:Dolichyl-phosphate-mannose--protein mannosyltransferase n=1 Tax=Triparma retinervis TaxID=2557542 RepID=A0A9W7AJZ9_9STRA|nr:hypothetical protein TrRE_jg10752 [Triparma retinervis]
MNLFVAFLPLSFLIPFAVFDPVLQSTPQCDNVPSVLNQRSGSPHWVHQEHKDICRQWTFIHTWDDEANFITIPMSHMSPLVRPASESDIPDLWDSFKRSLGLVRLNVYEPLAWTFGKSMIVGDMWREKLRGKDDGMTGGELNFDEYSFRVRRQTLWLHCANGGLLYALLYMILASWHVGGDGLGGGLAFAALLGATIWSLHPTMVEVIGWPSANPYALCGLFNLLCANVFVWCRLWARRGNVTVVLGTFLVVLFYVAGVLSKSASISLPFGLLVLDLLFVYRRRTLGLNFADLPWLPLYVPLFGATVALLYATVVANQDGTSQSSDFIDHGNGTEGGRAFVSRFVKSTLTLAHFLRLFFFPVGLRAHYAINEGELEGGDRYAYLTYLPLVTVVSGLVAGRAKGARVDGVDRVDRVTIGLVALLLSSYVMAAGTMSRSQLCTWCNDDAMIKNSLAYDPGDWRMVDIYSEYLTRLGRNEEAEVYLRRTLDVLPGRTVKAVLGRAKSLVMMGNSGRACEMYEEAYRSGAEGTRIPLLLNNVALCGLRAGAEGKEVGLRLIEEGLGLETVQHHEKVMRRNLDLLREWGGEGDFVGSLMW